MICPIERKCLEKKNQMNEEKYARKKMKKVEE
jgi:hypothetical protein